MRDFRYALRLLVRNPGFAALAVTTLALGIGASTAMFTVLDQVVLRPLPYGTPEELVFINETSVDATQTYSVSIPNFFDWRERNRTFVSMSALRAANFNLTSGEGPERIRGAMVSGDFFHTLAAAPLLGTAFETDDEMSVVLSHRAWQTRFGGQPDVLGDAVVLDGKSFLIRGVMREDFEFLTASIEMWLPIGVFENELPWEDRGSHPALWVVGRLAPGVVIAEAQRDMDRVATEIDAEFDHADRVAVTSLHDRSIQRSRGSLTSLMAAVGLLLLIACVNVASLVLTRASGRTREMATRAALGAARGRLARQLVTESLVLCSLSGLLGVLLASWGVELLKWLLPADTPRLGNIEIDATAFGFALVVSIVTGIGFGLAPLDHKNSSLRARMGRRAPVHAALVVAQVALAGMLIVGAGLSMKSFFHLASLDAGFETRDRIAARFDLTASYYGTSERSVRFYLELLDNIRALPGVQSAAVSTGLPLVDPGTESGILREGLEAERENFVLASFQIVSSDYFETLGVRLLAGRVLDDTDRAGAARVVVVDRTLAATMFQGESAVGKRFYMDGTPETPGLVTIVGVVEHVRTYQLSTPQYVQVYVPLEQPPSWMTNGFPPANLVIRSSSAPETMFSAVRGVVERLDPAQPIYGTTTLDDVRRTALTPERTNTILSSSFALAALGLAALGLYGVLASIVGQKTPEIGLKMALGATPYSVWSSVVGNALAMVGVGGALGLLGGLVVARFAASILHGVGEIDAQVTISTVGLLGVVAVFGCFVPARRAMRVQAVDALRHE